MSHQISLKEKEGHPQRSQDQPLLFPHGYWPGPYDEVLGLCERCHVSKGWLDQTVGGVTQEVAIDPGVGGRNPFGGEANLGGVWSQVVCGIQVEVCDVPEPAWRQTGSIQKICYIHAFRIGTLQFYHILWQINVAFLSYYVILIKKQSILFIMFKIITTFLLNLIIK